MSVAEIEQRHAAIDEAQDVARNEEAQRTFDQGVAAEEAGKLGVAKIYYRMAAKEATGPLKEQAEARLEKLAE